MWSRPFKPTIPELSAPLAMQIRRLSRLLTLSTLAIAVLSSTTAALRTQKNALQESYVFGMSTALSGPAADLGLNMQEGILAAFAEANRAGGIGGRELSLLALDDGYEPARTGPNMRELVTADVLSIVGNVGTPTAIVSVPIANESKTLLLGAYTGAGVLRKEPADRYVINYRASYAEETGAMVDALIEHGGLAAEEIAFFTQRDGYGDAGYSGGIAALRRHGLKSESQVAHGRYERNTTSVENGLADIMLAAVPPRAVIMVGAYGPCSKFIKLAHEFGSDALFLNVSFVGTRSLARDLGTDGEGVIITQVVPHYDSDLPLVEQYRKATGAGDPNWKPSFGSLEGYVVGRIAIEGLRATKGTVNRETFVDALNGLGAFKLGIGAPLSLSKSEHQASHSVWPTVLKKGVATSMSWSEIAELLPPR